VTDLGFDARGLRLHAKVRGEGPLTLLLHGWLDCCASFDLLAPLLPGRTVALDFRGHGDSAWLTGGFYHFIDYIADIDAALQHFSPERPARIVGHSMGGAIALLYCAARPERVTHLTMIDSLPMHVTPEEVPERAATYLADLRSFPRERRRIASVEEAAQRLRGNGFAERPAAILARGNTMPVEGGFAWKWDPLLRATSPLPVTDEIARAMVEKVTTPVFMIRAEHGVVPPEAEIRARFPSLQFKLAEVPGTGHHLHLEVPEVIARLIESNSP
jgi:pimeloyl-ACP methyl ester carboxylesterase